MLALHITAGAATTIGFHDASDPVKTIGWACATDAATPVRVHLYAEVDGAMKHLDSQLADKRRDDLPGTCIGAAHAFRFGDYAKNDDGIALYRRTDPIRMHVFAEAANGLQLLTASPRPVSFAAVNLWDAGLRSGRWRTDFDNPLEGTAAAPLLLGDCVFSTPLSDGYPSFSGGGTDALSHCRYDSIIMPASNAASSDAAWPHDSFWAVIGNVEPAFDNPLCVSGPPGQSRPFARPGAGELFGIVALPDGESAQPLRMKMHLVLNSWSMSGCRDSSYAIPYLSFGAQADRGNNGIITYLNNAGSKTTLRFGLTLMDIADAHHDPLNAETAQRYSQAHLLIEALWGGRKRWVFIELMPDARRNDGGADPGIDAHVRFNWHMVDSLIHPGADYVFKSAALLTAQCSAEGLMVPVLPRTSIYIDPITRQQSRIDPSIDLQRLFDCLNRIATWGAEPTPPHPIPITGIHFGVEMDDHLYRDGLFTGRAVPNAIWIAVDNIRIE